MLIFAKDGGAFYFKARVSYVIMKKIISVLDIGDMAEI